MISLGTYWSTGQCMERAKYFPIFATLEVLWRKGSIKIFDISNQMMAEKTSLRNSKYLKAINSWSCTHITTKGVA